MKKSLSIGKAHPPPLPPFEGGGEHEERGIAVFKSNKAASSRIAKKSNGCRGIIVVTKVLESLGLKVIRFDNYQVFNNLNEVVSAIFYEVQMRVARKNDF